MKKFLITGLGLRFDQVRVYHGSGTVKNWIFVRIRKPLREPISKNDIQKVVIDKYKDDLSTYGWGDDERYCLQVRILE